MKTNILFILLSIVVIYGCEDNNTAAPSTNNNNGGGGSTANNLCNFIINDTCINFTWNDTIYFPYRPGCSNCLSKTEVRVNIDLDNDGQNDDTRIRISGYPIMPSVTVDFYNGVFQGAGSYPISWDFATTTSSDCQISIKPSISDIYSEYGVELNQTFILTEFNSTIGQRVKGEFVGSLKNFNGITFNDPVPVQLYFDVPVTTN